MSDDRAERRLHAADLPERVASMSKRITQLAQEDVIRVTASNMDAKLSEEQLRELRGLGYIQ